MIVYGAAELVLRKKGIIDWRMPPIKIRSFDDTCNRS